MNDDGSPEPRQSGWPGLRRKLFHLLFLFRRPMTLGVRAVVYDRAANSVFLIYFREICATEVVGDLLLSPIVMAHRVSQQPP